MTIHKTYNVDIDTKLARILHSFGFPLNYSRILEQNVSIAQCYFIHSYLTTMNSTQLVFHKWLCGIVERNHVPYDKLTNTQSCDDHTVNTKKILCVAPYNKQQTLMQYHECLKSP